VYWNGDGLEDKARLRNFMVRSDLVPAAFARGIKAEVHRLGHEMSEDALSWNVFVSLAVAGQLREVAQHLIGRPLQSEPALYLWGHHIDLRHRDLAPYPELLRVRDMLEKDIPKFQTEPDIMLIRELCSRRGQNIVENRTGGRSALITVNSSVRTREYLTTAEIERLMAAARKSSRYGHRDATMILIGYRHGLRASERVVGR